MRSRQDSNFLLNLICLYYRKGDYFRRNDTCKIISLSFQAFCFVLWKSPADSRGKEKVDQLGVWWYHQHWYCNYQYYNYTQAPIDKMKAAQNMKELFCDIAAIQITLWSLCIFFTLHLKFQSIMCTVIQIWRLKQAVDNQVEWPWILDPVTKVIIL